MVNSDSKTEFSYSTPPQISNEHVIDSSSDFVARIAPCRLRTHVHVVRLQPKLCCAKFLAFSVRDCGSVKQPCPDTSVSIGRICLANGEAAPCQLKA